MRKMELRPPRFFPIFFAVSLIFAAVSAEAAAVTWLAFLPKAERAKAQALVATADALLASLAQDHSRAVAAERSYADAARPLAAILDNYADKPEALFFALSQAGQSGSSAESAAGVLADKRRLRWEVSRDIANLGYGHVDKDGIATAAATEDEIGRIGLSLREILAKRIAPIPRKSLLQATAAMEDRVASHPDCPSAAFAALRKAAAELEGPPYRAWMLALTPLLPGPLAADETVATGSSAAELAFRTAKAAFTAAYATRMILKEALPAAAAAAWYVDGTGSGVFVQESPQALASLSSFLRNLGAIDPRLVGACLAEDEQLAAAFAECIALTWAAYGRASYKFTADLGLEPPVVRLALGVAWKATARTDELAAPGVDLDAVRRAEGFVARMEEQRDSMRLLGILVELRRDRPAFEAVRLGARYASVRERCREAFSAALAKIAAGLEKEARKSPAAASVARGAPQGAPDPDATEESGPIFRLLTAGDDPFSTIALAAAFERPLGAVAFRTVVAPAVLARALGPLSGLVDSGALIVTIPCLVEEKTPSADELALLGAGLGWIGSGASVAAGVLARLCARYGVPVPFVSSPAALPQTARRFADFGATASRFMALSAGLGGER